MNMWTEYKQILNKIFISFNKNCFTLAPWFSTTNSTSSLPDYIWYENILNDDNYSLINSPILTHE